MKATALIVMVMATALVVSAANSQDKGRAKNQDESTKKISDLQKERIAALQAVADVAAHLVKSGQLSIEEACDAKLVLLRAQIDAAETDADRIKFCEDLVEAMKQYEEIAKARKASAQGTEVSVLKVKASRLEAEINLERLKAKMAK